MRKIEPMINDFDSALGYITMSPHPTAQFWRNFPQCFALHGGSIRHPITISLTYAVHGYRNFGRYYNQECHRLVICDGKYRTKYSLDEYGILSGSKEFDECKKRMAQFCREHGLRVELKSKGILDVYDIIAADEYFDGFGIRYRANDIGDHRVYGETRLDEANVIHVEIAAPEYVLNDDIPF